jgi:hypothetical protein
MPILPAHWARGTVVTRCHGPWPPSVHTPRYPPVRAEFNALSLPGAHGSLVHPPPAAVAAWPAMARHQRATVVAAAAAARTDSMCRACTARVRPCDTVVNAVLAMRPA